MFLTNFGGKTIYNWASLLSCKYTYGGLLANLLIRVLSWVLTRCELVTAESWAHHYLSQIGVSKLSKVVTQLWAGWDSGSETKTSFTFASPGWVLVWRVKTVLMLLLQLWMKADVTLGSKNKNTPAPRERKRDSERCCYWSQLSDHHLSNLNSHASLQVSGAKCKVFCAMPI